MATREQKNEIRAFCRVKVFFDAGPLTFLKKDTTRLPAS